MASGLNVGVPETAVYQLYVNVESSAAGAVLGLLKSTALPLFYTRHLSPHSHKSAHDYLPLVRETAEAIGFALAPSGDYKGR